MSKKNSLQAREARLRQAQEQAQAAARRQRITIASVVVGLLAVVGVGWWWMSTLNDPAPIAKDKPAGVTSEYGVVYGDADAPHKIVILEDFLCPFCGELERNHSDLIKQAAAAGTATVEYRPFDLLRELSDYSTRAANAYFVVLDAEGPTVAAAFHDELFAQQPPEQEPYPDNEWLIDLAVAAGANEDAIRDGITSGRFNDFVANANDSAQGTAGFVGTPTVYVDGEPLLYQTIDGFDEALAQALS